MKGLLLLTLPFWLACTNHSIKFDSEKWKSWVETEATMFMRWDMSSDLISNYNLEGKTKTEIENLLYGSPINCDKKECRIYIDLGPCRSGINYGTLTIYFSNGIVTKVERTCS